MLDMPCYMMFMHRRETVILRLKKPTKRKRDWLASTASAFGNAVHLALTHAQGLRTSSRAKIHAASYASMRCGYQVNADLNAVRNIAASGLYALTQGAPDTPWSAAVDQTGNVSFRPDGVQGFVFGQS